ncbi:16S rRNA (cytosine(967)-C(5))-methyltransferase RsmB [Marinibactrum halimedae]|uniref:16S rRNA (cytosine(967)-C(5))-methyltransferase n=1 Tax=Marinibactrum halimedae TaxID=1444977 RepID=A0AA37T8G4_9GAMM|nr:16S rRNA (cytosine(967)-C(5))-methyltransferase RsmB [Marinibactrum halimedae]MCD9460907.1 16S rRNA (cytosine(967)-C(5))-methyltransferase RsmB [Marinibactrum halimedae]GLS24582.1 ribosomal RNA small subunit methyltransferase B [Marinibactrum halimedae]
MATYSDVRVQAAQVIARLNTHQETLAQTLPQALDKVAERDRALLQELCFGTLRWYPRLKQVYLQLIETPLKAKEADIEALIFLGLYQLIYTRIPDHAALSATVDATKALKKPWASKLINAVLRRFQRESEALLATADTSELGRTAHPKWLLKAINQHWPNYRDQIIEANNAHPPFTLRVNTEVNTREQYRSALNQAGIEHEPCTFSTEGITLNSATSVDNLPGFREGHCSIQDEAAQLAAHLLQPQAGDRILDACCAPGGKTGHILEIQPDIHQLVALDISEKRLQQVTENLERLRYGQHESAGAKEKTETNRIQLAIGDASQPDTWTDLEHQNLNLQQTHVFDRILIDAPCSATGVIRRHPDIKQLRIVNDIKTLADLQLSILNGLWPLLKPGGILVYATCSIMPTENSDNIARFLAMHTDATDVALAGPWGIAQPHGRQLLPHVSGHDGFYYCVLMKQAG